MNFIDSIKFPLKVWHALGLSTFQIDTIPSVHLSIFRKIYTIFISVCYLYRLFNLPVYRINRESFAQLLFQMVQTFYLAMLPAVCLIILIESMLKPNKQRKFIEDLMEIDKQFERRLNINLQYSNQKRQNIQRFIRWMAITLMMGLVYPVVGLVGGALFVFLMSPLVGAYCKLNMSLRVYQYTTFVDMINFRYSLINKYINEFYAKSFDQDFSKQPFFLVKPFIGQGAKVNYQQIQSLREICRSLNTLSRQVNELFSVSLSLCILFDFCGFFAIYDALKSTFVYENVVLGCVVACDLVSSVNNLVSMAIVCAKASEEVRSIFFF